MRDFTYRLWGVRLRISVFEYILQDGFDLKFHCARSSVQVVVFQRLGERIVDVTSEHIVDATDSEKLSENKLSTKVVFAGTLETPLPQELLSVGGDDDPRETDPGAVIRHEVMLTCVDPGLYEIGVKCKLNQRPRSLQLSDTEENKGVKGFDLWWHSTLHAQVSR